MADEGSFVRNSSTQCFVSQGGRVLKSKITKLVLVAIAAVVSFQVNQTANAQGANAGLVAILDVAKVFKENLEFTAQMQSIKAEAERLKVDITAEQDAIKGRAQQVTQYEVGTAERNKFEGDLEIQQAALRTKARQAEAGLLNREARIYYATYQKMQGIVSSVATQNNISLVLRFDSQDIDQTKRDEVIKGVNRAVVYHNRLDLTSMVTKAMNAGAAQAAAPTGTQNK
ncbi:MAG: OmpH family outer membrane protein [Mariniblastus sp.]|nr:OmpH family outer membrane protein [Mariniblastus sp.]